VRDHVVPKIPSHPKLKRLFAIDPPFLVPTNDAHAKVEAKYCLARRDQFTFGFGILGRIPAERVVRLVFEFMLINRREKRRR
jgi:hypothetical protein